MLSRSAHWMARKMNGLLPLRQGMHDLGWGGKKFAGQGMILNGTVIPRRTFSQDDGFIHRTLAAWRPFVESAHFGGDSSKLDDVWSEIESKFNNFEEYSWDQVVTTLKGASLSGEPDQFVKLIVKKDDPSLIKTETGMYLVCFYYIFPSNSISCFVFFAADLRASLFLLALRTQNPPSVHPFLRLPFALAEVAPPQPTSEVIGACENACFLLFDCNCLLAFVFFRRVVREMQLQASSPLYLLRHACVS